MTRRSLCIIGAITATIIGVARPTVAHATRSWAVSDGGATLVISVTSGEAIAPRCQGDIVWLGPDLATTAACHPLTKVTINGSAAADYFMLTGMLPTDFPLLPKLFVNTKAGADQVFGGPLNEIVTLGDGDDQMRAGAGNDQVKGNGGNDTIRGDDGVDILNGDGGDDRLEGCVGLVDCIDDGRNTMNGGSGNDRLIGGPNNDVLNGNDGNDRLQGGPGDDEVLGGNGDDIIDGDGFDLRVGTDRLGGGGGSDTIIGNNLDDAGDVSPEVDHFRWKVTFDASPLQIEGIVSGQPDDDVDLQILTPGTWSLTGVDSGLSVRQARTDPLFKWRLNFNGFTTITMRMSTGNDKLYVWSSPTMAATVLGGAGTDRLSVPVDGPPSLAIDTGSTITTPGNLPINYSGFETVTLWDLNGPAN